MAARRRKSKSLTPLGLSFQDEGLQGRLPPQPDERPRNHRPGDAFFGNCGVLPLVTKISRER